MVWRREEDAVPVKTKTRHSAGKVLHVDFLYESRIINSMYCWCVKRNKLAKKSRFTVLQTRKQLGDLFEL